MVAQSKRIGSQAKRWLVPSVIKQPFAFDQWKAKRKVKKLVAFIQAREANQQFTPLVLKRARKLPSSLAYQVVKHLVDNPSMLDSRTKVCHKKKKALRDDILPLLEKGIARQISKRQLGVVSSLTVFFSFIVAIVYFVYFYGLGTEKELLENFLETAAQEANTTDQVLKLREPFAARGLSKPTLFDIDPLDEGTSKPDIGLDINKIPRARQVLKIAASGLPTSLGASSVAAGDERVSFHSHPSSETVKIGGFAGFYTDIVGAKQLKHPVEKPFYLLPVVLVDNPALIGKPEFSAQQNYLGSVTFHDENKQGRYALIAFFSRIYPMVARFQLFLAEAYSFTQHFQAELDSAAKIFASAHSELHLPNVQIALRLDTMKNQAATTAEDPWQDLVACQWSNCDMLPQLEEAIVGKKIGPSISGQPVNLPWWLWRGISFSRKYNIDRQSFGPQHILVGMAKQAAARSDILNRYQPYLSSADFVDTKAVLRAILNPQKAIFTRVMVYDYVISQLKAGLFKDSRVRLPAEIAPYIADQKTAREYSLLKTAYHLMHFPEQAPVAEHALLFLDPYYHINLRIFGELFGIKPHLPGLLGLRYENSAAVYFGAYNLIPKQ